MLEQSQYNLEESAKVLGITEKQIEKLIKSLTREGYPTEALKRHIKENKANLRRFIGANQL